MKNTIKEDLSMPLDKINRNWIRRPALICITPFIILFGMFEGITNLVGSMYRDCWTVNK